VYSLGSAMTRQFYEEQRVASSQGTSRVAIMELRRDISRAGLFGSPNADLEPTCDTNLPTLPKLTGGTGPMGAFQYYADYDQSAVFDLALNPDVHADRLRILTSLYLTDQLLVHSAGTDSAGNSGGAIVLQAGNQAYRRTFSWGQPAGPFTGSTATAPDYLTGDLGWDSNWSGATASWYGIAQKGARAFQTGSVLHIETDHGRHFFRSVFGKDGITQGEVRLRITPPLPLGTACLPGAAEGATVAPLQWVEYAVVDPFVDAQAGAGFMDFSGMFSTTLSTSSPTYNIPGAGGGMFEESNRVLVRRVLDAATGNVRFSSTQVIAEFVSNFQVSFLIDTTSGTATPTLTASSNENTINDDPQQVRSVIIDLGIRSPLEDPTIDTSWTPDGGTRFNVNDTQTGAARVRNMRIEIPVMNVARRNL